MHTGISSPTFFTEEMLKFNKGTEASVEWVMRKIRLRIGVLLGFLLPFFFTQYCYWGQLSNLLVLFLWTLQNSEFVLNELNSILVHTSPREWFTSNLVLKDMECIGPRKESTSRWAYTAKVSTKSSIRLAWIRSPFCFNKPYNHSSKFASSVSRTN